MVKREISLVFEGKPLPIEGIYEQTNRLYIPVEPFIKELADAFPGKSIDEEGLNSVIIDEMVCIPLFQLTQVLDLKTTWDYERKIINLFINREKAAPVEKNKGSRPALIRLEDISPGGSYGNAESLEKLRVISDLFFSKGISFHVAWIPRYVNPGQNIDNDLVRDYSIFNCDFVFTLDYMISKGAVIGLHGYTHQFGDEITGDGSEFTQDRFTTESEIRERVKKAIDTANALNIPYSFFESPHYAATKYQMSIIEDYFDYIYEAERDYIHIFQPYKSSMNHRTIYVPTPLGYVKSNKFIDVFWMLLKILFLPKRILASMFYHPTIEFSFIEISRDNNGYPVYEYKKNSILNKIIKALKWKDCIITKFTDVNPS